MHCLGNPTMHCLGNPTMHRPVSVGDEQTGTGEGRIEAKLNSQYLIILDLTSQNHRPNFLESWWHSRRKPYHLGIAIVTQSQIITALILILLLPRQEAHHTGMGLLLIFPWKCIYGRLNQDVRGSPVDMYIHLKRINIAQFTMIPRRAWEYFLFYFYQRS